MKTRIVAALPALVAVGVALWPATGRATPTVNSTVVRAPLIGQLALPAPSQAKSDGTSSIGFYGADLGFTMVSPDSGGHKQLRVVFGDSWSNNGGGGVGPTGIAGGDTQGFICLTAGPNCPASGPLFGYGAAVDSFIDSSALHGTDPMHQGPPITMLTTSGFVAPIGVYRGGANGTLLDMGSLRTPVAVFDNGLSGATHGSYGIFLRGVGLQCTPGLPPTCPGNLTCDGNLWGELGPWNDGTLVPCLPGASGCLPLATGGFCVDTTSSVYADDPRMGVVETMEVGNADPSVNSNYYCQDWNTNKFINPVTRLVNDFVATRSVGSTSNDFNPPDSTTTGREAVFLWGRPWFTGVGGTDELYFAYASVPTYSASGQFSWAPQYYKGILNNAPQFTTDQTQAVPLSFISALRTVGPKDSTDIIQQMSISWIDSLHQWMMAYGGDEWPTLDNAYGTPATTPDGSILVRFADQPWGPWSAPQVLFDPGSYATPSGQFKPGGTMFSSLCSGATCALEEPFYKVLSLLPNEVPPQGAFGTLYAPSIIEPWTLGQGLPSAATVYWSASTFDPYGTVLMRSYIEASPFEQHLVDTTTPLPSATNGAWVMSDHDRDGLPDLTFIQNSNTPPSNDVQIHIATGSSLYQTQLPVITTAFADENNGVWTMGNYDKDGIPDLIYIKTVSTGSKMVEVHVVSASSNFQQFVLHGISAFAPQNTGVYTMADYDNDGIVDLIFIQDRGTASGNVELSIATGASKYKNVVPPTPIVTGFPEENDGTWTMADYDHDGHADLVFIKTTSPAGGDVEVDLATYAKNYTPPVVLVATFAQENDGYWMMSDVNVDGAGDLVFIRTPGSGPTEVHAMSGN